MTPVEHLKATHDRLVAECEPFDPQSLADEEGHIDPRDWPEGHLWVYHPDHSMTSYNGEQLQALLDGTVQPVTLTERLLVEHPIEIERILRCLGQFPVSLDEGELPEWSADPLEVL